MIQSFVDKFLANRPQFTSHPDDYGDIVKAVIEAITDDMYDSPDPERIHVIDDGDYQGTLLYIIAATGYQPSTYWGVSVSYGSCSGCDTLESIRSYDDNPPTPDQVEDYQTLALHVVQGLRNITDEN